MEKRRSSRNVISLDARIVSSGISHSGVTVNLSGEGIYMVTTSSRDVIDFPQNTTVKLHAVLPTQETLDLKCSVKWFQKNTSPNGTTFKMGMEIIDPPPVYRRFIKSHQ